jgi:hypothetical protein
MKAGVGLLGLALAGCASTPQSATERFRCDRGTLLAIVFLDDHAMLQAGDEAPVRLEQQRVGSGFSYMSATRSIRGKGRALAYSMGRMAPEECTNIED